MNTPVYRAQCKTFAILKIELGLAGNVATPGNHIIALFRLIPPYRSQQSLDLRKRIADMVRANRKR